MVSVNSDSRQGKLVAQLPLTTTQIIPYDSFIEEHLDAITTRPAVSPRETTYHFHPQSVKYFLGKGALPYQLDKTRGDVVFALDKSRYKNMTANEFRFMFGDFFGALNKELGNLLSDDSKFKFIYFEPHEMSRLAPFVSNPELVDQYRAQRKEEDDFALGIINDTASEDFVDGIINRAISERASDIHFETFGEKYRVRFRVDGDLRVSPNEMSPTLYRSTIGVLKIRCGEGVLMQEHRKPQDGKIKHSAVSDEGKISNYDLRVAFCPVIGGKENAILRIAQRGSFKSLEELGFGEDEYKRILPVCSSPNGILLVTGPTGSGKTTTLYAMLEKMNTPQTKVITIEDPVEQEMAGLQQTQVNRPIGLDFDSFLKNILRMDPDVVFVGEIRDQETAELAIQCSMTGHVVLSSLHTNNSPGAVSRLRNMGISKLDLAGNLRGVIAQTLVPVYEKEIKQRILSGSLTSEDSNHLLHIDLGDELNILSGEKIYPIGRAFAVNGDEAMFKGREALTEFWEIDEKSEDAIGDPAVGSAVLTRIAEESGMRPMFISGIEKVMSAGTSLEHVLGAVGKPVFKRKVDLLKKYIKF